MFPVVPFERGDVLELTLDEPTLNKNVDVLGQDVLNQLLRLRDGHYKQINVTYKNGLCSNLYKGQSTIIMRWRRNALVRPIGHGQVTANCEQNFAVDTFLGKDKEPLVVFDVDEESAYPAFPELNFRLSEASLKRTVYGDAFSKCKLSSANECYYIPILDKWVRVYPNQTSLVVSFGITGADTLNISTLPTVDVGSAVEHAFLPRGLPVFNRLANDIVAFVGHRLPSSGRCVINCASIDIVTRRSLKLTDAPVKFFRKFVDPKRIASATLFKDDIVYDQKRSHIRRLSQQTAPLSVMKTENFQSVNINFAQCGSDAVVVNVTLPVDFKVTNDASLSAPGTVSNEWRMEILKNVYTHKDAKPCVDYGLLWKDYATRYENKYQFNSITDIY